MTQDEIDQAKVVDDADRDLVIDILRRVGCNRVLSPAQLIASFTLIVAGAGPRASRAARNRFTNASSETLGRWVARARKALAAALETGQVYQRSDNCIGLHRRFALALVTPPPKSLAH